MMKTGFKKVQTMGEAQGSSAETQSELDLDGGHKEPTGNTKTTT